MPATPIPQRYSVVVCGFNAWSSMWKRTQTLSLMMSEDDWCKYVLFLNRDVYLGSLLRNPFGELSYTRRTAWRALIPQKVTDHLTVATPLVPPFSSPGRPLFPLRRGLVQALVRSCTEPLMLYVNRLIDPKDEVFRVLSRRASNTLFDWSDDFASFAQDLHERRQAERLTVQLLRHADLVLAVNDTLRARAEAVGAHAVTIPNGTNYRIMSAATESETPVDARLLRLGHPIIGYMGYLNSTRLDLELLLAVVRKRPNWSFVFVGPEAHPRPLGDVIPTFPNVHILRPVPYERLPSVLKGFDVAILPNRINCHTAGNDPIKLFDYLAAGKVIVATRTAGTERLSDHLLLADDVDEFLAALSTALARAANRDTVCALQKLARAHSWEARYALLRSSLMPLLATVSRGTTTHD